jgi:hypothetical protein
MWYLNGEKDELAHHKLDTRSRRLAGGRVLDGALRTFHFRDMWPEPGTGTDDKFTLFTVSDSPTWNNSKSAVQRFEWNKNTDEFNRLGWELPANQTLSQIRLVSPAIVYNDLDTMPKDIRQRVRGASIIYATLDGSREILVSFTDAPDINAQWRVPILPSSYHGIAVDPYLLWVYGHEGFQCATHSSVMRCVKTGGTPRWLGYGHPDGIGDVLDLSSCDDGTLLVSTRWLCAERRYSIDLKKAASGARDGLVLAGKWENLGGVRNAKLVQKLPMYGWDMVESLNDYIMTKQPA